MGSILALDYGSKKLGIAYSDSERTVTSRLPALHVQNQNEQLKQVHLLLTKYQCDTLLIGIPLHADGSESDWTKNVRSFIVELQKLNPNLEIVERNEFATSRFVRAAGTVSKAMVDSEVARMMLEEYLSEKGLSE